MEGIGAGAGTSSIKPTVPPRGIPCFGVISYMNDVVHESARYILSFDTFGGSNDFRAFENNYVTAVHAITFWSSHPHIRGMFAIERDWLVKISRRSSSDCQKCEQNPSEVHALRLATNMDTDTIMGLDAGGRIASGHPRELLQEREGQFRKMWDQQRSQGWWIFTV